MHARRLFVLALAAGCLALQGVWVKEGAATPSAAALALGPAGEADGNGPHLFDSVAGAGAALLPVYERDVCRSMVTVEVNAASEALLGRWLGPARNDGRGQIYAVALAALLEEEAAEEAGEPPSAGKQPGPGPGGPIPGAGVPGPTPMFDPIFRALDTDEDGTLSAEEIEAAPETLKKLDKDGDGSIARAELMPPGGPGFGPPSPEQIFTRFMERDQDKNGKLSKDEVPDFLKQHFEAVDKNEDGFIDEEELKGAMQALMAAFGPGGRDGPGAGLPPFGGPGFGPGAPGLAPQQLLEQLFKTHDKDEDSKLTEDELPEPLRPLLKELDENEDDALDMDELKKNPEKVMTAIGPTAPSPLGPGGLVGGYGGPGGPGGAGPGMMQGMARQMFSNFDQNKDGKLSRDEVPIDFGKNFDTFDADGDNALTVEEFLAAMKPGGKQTDSALINRILRHDEDGDGQISEEEAPQFIKKHFAKLDTNSDGYLDEQELQQGIATLRELLGPAKAKKKAKKTKAKAEKSEGA